MIYSWIGSLFDGCAPQFGTIFVICAIVNALLCILLIPICIRLAGKLVAQVFKYRYIVKNHLRAFDDDRKVIIAYYQHFQIFMGIILNILGFCIFNSIYQIYMSVYVKNIQIGMQCIVGFVAGAFAEAFQEGIILFGVTLLLQIAYYFKLTFFITPSIHLYIFITPLDSQKNSASDSSSRFFNLGSEHGTNGAKFFCLFSLQFNFKCEI